MDGPKNSDHIERNQVAWQRWAPEYAEWAPRAWSQDEPSWGIFSIPDSEVGALPAVARRVSTSSSWGAAPPTFLPGWRRRGARPVGVDISPAQLDTGPAMQPQFGLEFPLHLGNAEETPFPDASFDLVSASTAPRSGVIPTAGFPRLPASSAPAALWPSSSTACC